MGIGRRELMNKSVTTVSKTIIIKLQSRTQYIVSGDFIYSLTKKVLCFHFQKKYYAFILKPLELTSKNYFIRIAEKSFNAASFYVVF